MPRCIFGATAALEAVGIAAGLSDISAERFGRLLQIAYGSLEADDIRTRLPTVGRFTLLPLHRLQQRLPKPRGKKARYMLVLARLPSGDWYVVATVRDNMLSENAMKLAEARLGDG